MTQTIRTKWHKILPLIRSDEVYLTAPPNGKAQHWKDFKPNRELTEAFIKSMGDLPKFVIEPELMEIAQKENYQQSLLDMKDAGVMRLPYPAMTVEFETTNSRVIVMLRDNLAPEMMEWEPPLVSGEGDFRSIAPFYGVILRIHHDEDGDYLVLSPSICTIDIRRQEGSPWLQLWGTPHEIMEQSQALSDLVKATYTKDTAWIWRALSAAMLLMHTGGVEKEVIECERLNRKRLNSKKPLIPRHTYLKIGRVYKSAASDEASEYIPRRSPIPHWRKGYNLPVRHGPKRTSVKLVYIYPKLVAFKDFDGAEPPKSKEYHVSK